MKKILSYIQVSMKTHTTNYYNSFIEVSEDCSASVGEVPQPRKGNETIASLQYRLLMEHPYEFTSDEVLFQVHALRKEIPPEEIEAARKEFFSKGQACFRASPLTKRYGWGVHFDREGKMALYARETKAYDQYSRDKNLDKLKSMRSRRG